MPVNIPTIQRNQNQVQALPQNNRVNVQANNNSQDIIQKGNVNSAIVDEGKEIYQQVQLQKIENLSTEAEKEYSKWNSEKLGQLKAYKGDPTDAYVQYDKDVKEKRDQMLAARPDIDGEIKEAYTSRVNRMVEKQNLGAMSQRGMQQEVYDETLYRDSLSMKKQGLPVSAGHVKAGDKTSYAPFQDGLNEITTTIAKRGLKYGTVTQVKKEEGYTHSYPTGKINPETKEPEIAYVRMSDNAKLQVAKETSEGVRNSLNVLIADDRVDDAKDMLENYKNHLTPADRVALQKKLTTSERKTEANTFLNSMGGLSSAEQLKRIEGIKDFELKQEVMNKKHSYDTKMEDYRKRKMKANDDVLLNTILDRQNSDQPFYGVSDMQDDKTFKAVYDNASPKAKQAAIEMFNAPKESKPEALANVQSLFLGSGEGIDKLSPTEFQQKIVGLSKTDKTKYTNMYMNMRTETQGEQRATYRVAGKMLQDQLLLNEHIKRNGFNKIAGDDELELIRANDALFEHLSDRPDIRGDDTKLKEFVKQYSASLAKGKVFKPAAPATVQQKSSTTKPTTGNVTLPTGPELTALKKAYKGKYGSFPAYPGKDEDALKSFFKTR